MNDIDWWRLIKFTPKKILSIICYIFITVFLLLFLIDPEGHETRSQATGEFVGSQLQDFGETGTWKTNTLKWISELLLK